MLTYWRMTRKFSLIAGIGFGNFSINTNSDQENSSIINLIIERFKEFDFPIVYDLPIGHRCGNACIPYGYDATLNGNNGSISFNSPC